MKGLFIFLYMLLSSSVLAEASLPSGCQAMAVKGETVTLKLAQKSLIFIHNLTQADLWITHPESNPSASAGWSSRLQANHWSALVVDKSSFNLSCIESKPGHEQVIPCEGAIAVCQAKKVKMPEDGEATFWVGEDQLLSTLTTSLGSRGFVLPTETNDNNNGER